jgi:hypothetical protein
MTEATLTITQELMDKLDRLAPVAGYDDGAQFATAILEREVAKLEDADANQQIEDRLRGLGYIS